MLFLLATPDYNNTQANTTKVRVHLKNGVAEVFDKHQDLMGKIENNLIEIETNFENKLEKFLFVVQDAVFIVSNKGLDGNAQINETGVYVYAKKVREIGKNFPIDILATEYEKRKAELDIEIQKIDEKDTNAVNKIINSRILLIKDDVEFLNKALLIAKELKNWD